MVDIELEDTPQVYWIYDTDQEALPILKGYYRRSNRRRISCITSAPSGKTELLFNPEDLCARFKMDVFVLSPSATKRWSREFEDYRVSPGVTRFFPAKGSLCDDEPESHYVDNGPHMAPFKERLLAEAEDYAQGKYEPKQKQPKRIAPAQQPAPAKKQKSSTPFSLHGLNIISTESELDRMLQVLFNKKRDLAVVVVTRRMGFDHAFVDTEELAHELDDAAWLFEITDKDLEFQLTKKLQDEGAEGCEVYNGAIRLYPAPTDYGGTLSEDRFLFKAFPDSDGRKLAESIASSVIGLRVRSWRNEPAPEDWKKATATVEGIFAGANRALLRYADGMCTARSEEIATSKETSGLSIDHFLQKGMVLHGRIDPRTKLLRDFAEELRVAPEDAIRSYQEGQTILVRVTKVTDSHCAAVLFPGIEADIAAADICESDLLLSDIVNEGQVLPALIVSHDKETGEWLLSVSQADDHDIQPAPALLKGGPSWLLPEDIKQAPTASSTSSRIQEKIDMSGLTIPESADADCSARITAYYIRWMKAEQECEAQAKAAKKAQDKADRFAEKFLSLKNKANSDASKRYRRPALSKFSDEKERIQYEGERLDWLMKDAWFDASTPSDRKRDSLTSKSRHYGEGFFESLSEVDVQLSKVLRCMIDVLLGRAAKRQEHPLRENEGANAPARTTANGVPVMRCYIEEGHASAARLHYAYEMDGSITFLSVRKHDDMRI